MSNIENIIDLIRKSKIAALSDEESARLVAWKNANETNLEMFNKLNDDYLIGLDLIDLSNIDTTQSKKHILKQIGFKRPLYYVYRGLAAACLLTFLTIYGIQLYEKKSGSKTRLSRTEKRVVIPNPKGAILTLLNGQTILLDTIKNGKIASQGNVDIINDNGKISYISRTTGKPVNGDNIVTIPKGKSFELVLPDKTKVWLNSGSSIKYPLSFSNKERMVAMTGEAYFEVTKDKLHPFIVTTNNEKVKVLGTHFNINSYPNQKVAKTTLLEGSVQVNMLNDNELVKLTPGQQSQITKGQKIKIVDDIDENEILAWKNGLFVFNKTSLQEILQTLSNWYDIKINYVDQVEERYTLTESRSTSLNEILKHIEKSGGAHFKVDHNTIIVSH